MLMKSTTLFLAITSIVAAASNTADVSSISNEIGEPRTAADVEDRTLLHSDTGCITIRVEGDDNADKNSVVLENLSTGRTIYELEEGDIEPGTRVDSDCIKPDAGDLLKLTITSPEGYSSSGFHAMFVGTLRAIRVAGNDKNDEDVTCFRLLEDSPYYEWQPCEAAAAAAEAPPASSSSVSSPPPPSPPANIPQFSSRMGCGSGEKSIRIVFEKDDYNENKFWVENKRTGRKVIECGGPGNYCETQTIEECLPADDYEIIMEDGLGDGCPKFEMYMENSRGQWSPLFTKCYNGRTWSRHFHTKTVQMTQREQQWLDEHNERRAKYWYDGSRLKTNGNPQYVPAKWDPELAAAAQRYADELLDDCHVDSMSHDRNRNGAGENMAKNRGTPGTEYGSLYPPSGILNRFVEMELDNEFGERYHLTQVLWQASAYVGCADGFKTYTDNGVLKNCHTQVCRYAAPGNCGVNANNDFERMMLSADEQNCGMRLPPSGMYAA